MRYQLFGGTGLRVSELFLGAMTFGEQGGVGAPPEECARILGAYADAGGNVIDTAINYRGGLSEEILGALLDGRRDQFVLSTKYTVSRDRDDPNGAGNHRKNLRLSLETSLRRLRTDYLDIYWVHMWDRHTPAEETMRALDDQVRAGKILYLGISDAPAWLIARANTLAEWRGWTAFAGLQAPYSLLQRDIERELLPMAEALGLTVAGWSPLADGILSGKFTATGAAGPGTRVDPASLTEHQRAVAATVAEVAGDLGASPAQVAIAWTRTRSPAIHPILGARRLDQLLDNRGAADLELPAEALARLEAGTEPDLGFPATFIRDTGQWVFGAAALTG
ncbi:MAG TPA: aldo/keto reductase [Streptosporangiaceae bacterium]|nr:aldo/keto reductase [Streptosporangiaceae bacterium]